MNTTQTQAVTQVLPRVTTGERTASAVYVAALIYMYGGQPEEVVSCVHDGHATVATCFTVLGAQNFANWMSVWLPKAERDHINVINETFFIPEQVLIGLDIPAFN